MNRNPIKMITLMFGIFMTITSCVKETDYKEVEVVELSPIITSNLATLTNDASSFFDQKDRMVKSIVSDTMPLEINNSKVLSDRIMSTNLTITLKNTLDIDFAVDFKFLNDANELIYEFKIPVSAASLEKAKTIETIAIIEEPELVSFKKSTKIVVSMQPSVRDTWVLEESVGSLEMEAIATYTFDWQ